MRRLLVLLALLLGGACGIPVEGQAEQVQDVPFGLMDPDAPAPAETEDPGEGPVIQVYLIDPSGQQLIPVERRLAEAPLPAVVAALMAGPTAAERAEGLGSALTDDSAVASVELVGGVASVDLTAQFTVLDGPTQRLAIAQLVFTLTSRPGLGRVSFTLEGQPIDIPRGDGTLATGSVARDNYRELMPGTGGSQ